MTDLALERITFAWRAAYEDMRERGHRLEERNAVWLLGFHRRFGGEVR